MADIDKALPNTQRTTVEIPGQDELSEQVIQELNRQQDVPEEALKQTNLLSADGYKDGGLTKTVAPQEGPMSAGVASLFKNK